MRSRGMVGHVMTDPEITGPGDSYALLVRPDGEMRMVHSEGVAYLVTDEKPWRWSDYREGCPTFTPAALLAARTGCREVDIADWIRVFGQRLESNFCQIAWWYEQSEVTE